MSFLLKHSPQKHRRILLLQKILILPRYRYISNLFVNIDFLLFLSPAVKWELRLFFVLSLYHPYHVSEY